MLTKVLLGRAISRRIGNGTGARISALTGGGGIGLSVVALAAAGFLLASCASSAWLDESRGNVEQSDRIEGGKAPGDAAVADYREDGFRPLVVGLVLY